MSKKSPPKSTSTNPSNFEVITKVNPGDMPSGQVPKMENPPPPPKKD